jgi:hypothetical protein
VSLLGRTWALHDVDDVERLSRKALDDALRTRGIHLRPHEHADAVAFLVSECWRLSVGYDPARTSRFSTYAYRRLRLLVWDWHRREYGRTRWAFGNGYVHERPRPDVLRLDDPDGNPLVDALTAGGGDDAADRVAARGGLLDVGSGEVDRDLEILRRAARRRAA